MRIGLLLPSLLASVTYRKSRIFAPLAPAVALVNGLVESGHDVTFYTAPGVRSKARLVTADTSYERDDLSYFQFRFRDAPERRNTAEEVRKRDFEYALTLSAYEDARDGHLDIIHAYHDFGAHYFNELTRFPTVYTLHDPTPQDSNTLEYLRFKRFANHNYIALSNAQQKGALKINFVATVYHGLDLSEHEFGPTASDYFIYFGRIIEDKGVHLAIQAAKELNTRLRIASSASAANREAAYYEEKIAPAIDGKTVIMDGYLSEKAKIDFIKKAKAFVFPLLWEEPFGLTIIEAMACGTPVVAFARGSAPELIKDGVTGFLVDPADGIEGLKKALQKIATIDRKACRTWVEERFTAARMVKDYVNVYSQILDK